MKAYLRLMREVRPRIKLSTFDHEQSAETYRRLPVLNRHLPTKYQLSPKTYKRIPLLLFILVFVSCGAAMAQESVVQTTPAAKAETEITPLKIGDKIPDELWEMFFPVVSANSDEVQYLSLGDFKDKLIILDFWATWCAPCISSLHKLDILQEQFKDDLLVIPTTYEPESKIKPFLIDRAINLPTLIDEKDLKVYFPHKAIPFQVWIKSNELLATTSENQATHENIAEFIEQGNSENLLIRTDNLNYNSREPLLFNNNGGDSRNLKYSSVITGYLEGIFGGGGVMVDSLGRTKLRIMNADVGRLYRTAASRHNPKLLFPNRMFLDNSIEQLIPNGKPYYQPELQPYFYSYEILVPPINDSLLTNYMLDDLNRFFSLTKGIEGYLAKKDIPCWVFSVERNDKENSIQSTDSDSKTLYAQHTIEFVNQPSKVVFSEIEKLFFTIDTPLVNEMTTANLSIKIPYNEENLSFQEVKNALILQGINVKKEIRQIEGLILKKIN